MPYETDYVQFTHWHYYFDLGLPNFFDNERDIVTAAAIYCTCNLKVTRGAREHLALGSEDINLALRMVPKNIFLFEFPSFLLLTNLRQQMHNPSAQAELPPPNLSGAYLLALYISLNKQHLKFTH